VRGISELSRDALAQARVAAEVVVAPRLAPVYIDADLVSQVLLNISLNSIQAMPRGGTVRYEVRTVRRRPTPRGPGRRAGDLALGNGAPRGAAAQVPLQQVRITDDGVGMSRGVLAKLFHPFFSTKPRARGSGVDLTTIMQEHGGTIEVLSREGHGTTGCSIFPWKRRRKATHRPTPAVNDPGRRPDRTRCSSLTTSRRCASASASGPAIRDSLRSGRRRFGRSSGSSGADVASRPQARGRGRLQVPRKIRAEDPACR
jgi:hypothetical protein